MHVAPQAAGFRRSWWIDFFLAQKHELLQSNSLETWAEFQFNWVYTFSAMLNSLRNWANHDRYQLRPSTPTQLCWSSSRLQPLRKYIICNNSAINFKLRFWNCWGAPNETTCFTGFFSVSQLLKFIFAWICLIFVPINSLSLSEDPLLKISSQARIMKLCLHNRKPNDKKITYDITMLNKD